MKTLLFALLRSSGAIRFVSWLNRRNVTILGYHSVTDAPELVHEDTYKQHISPQLFLRHLDHLQQNFCVISLTDFILAKREHRRLPDYSVVLTFDDGFQDFFTVVAPHLISRQLPATVFVITDRTHGRLFEGKFYLSWAQIQTLSARGIQVGSHTCSHVRLPDLPFEELRRELADARTAILDHVNQEDVPLSYPYGESSEAVSKLVHSLGHSCGITGTLGPNRPDGDPFLLNRTTIASDDDLGTFAARVSGLTWWANRLRQYVEFRTRKDWAQNQESLVPRPIVARRRPTTL